MQHVTILDIPFGVVTLEQALELVLANLGHQKGHPFFVATPNPEMLLEARKNPVFREVLQHTDLNIADGVGIIFASKIQRTSLPERVTGTDLMQKICANASNGTRFFLLGAAEGVAEKAKDRLVSLYPHIDVVGTYSGSPALEDEKMLREMIVKSGAEVLFVAFGAPKQELWLARNLKYLPNVKVAMGIGGAFDFIAGVRKRAPAWMQKLGLEWLYRLLKQPSRIVRIYNATIKFPIVFLWSILH